MTEQSAAASRSFPEREDGMFGGCPIYAEARSANECGKCGGDLLQCPVYGDGERKRQAEDRAAAFVTDPYAALRRKSKVGDWIWYELLAGRAEADILAEFRNYLRELDDRLAGENLQAEKSA